MGKRTNTAKWMDAHKRWQINVQKDGRRRSFYSSTPGRNGQRECNAKADAWLDNNVEIYDKRISALLDEYIKTLQLTTSKGNWMQVESNIKVWICPEIGNKRIEKLNEQDLQTVIDKAYNSGKSKKTLKNIRAVLMSFLKYCRKRKLTTLLPEDLSIPKGARSVSKRILQPEDVSKLFSINTTILAGKRVFEPYINGYRLQLLTGLRPGELLGLKWSDVRENLLLIRRSINCHGDITKGKNENAIRNIALGQKALEVIEQQKEHSFGSDYIFPITTQNHYEERLKRFCVSNDMQVVTPYELRHTFVSIAKVLPEGQVRAVVGHSRSMDTFGIYGHAVSGEQEKIAQSLDQIFDGILSPQDSKKGQ